LRTKTNFVKPQHPRDSIISNPINIDSTLTQQQKQSHSHNDPKNNNASNKPAPLSFLLFLDEKFISQ